MYTHAEVNWDTYYVQCTSRDFWCYTYLYVHKLIAKKKKFQFSIFYIHIIINCTKVICKKKMYFCDLKFNFKIP